MLYLVSEWLWFQYMVDQNMLINMLIILATTPNTLAIT